MMSFDVVAGAAKYAQPAGRQGPGAVSIGGTNAGGPIRELAPLRCPTAGEA
jgi:hypothetical protein